MQHNNIYEQKTIFEASYFSAPRNAIILVD
jgi:hypothetical protein